MDKTFSQLDPPDETRRGLPAESPPPDSYASEQVNTPAAELAGMRRWLSRAGFYPARERRADGGESLDSIGSPEPSKRDLHPVAEPEIPLALKGLARQRSQPPHHERPESLLRHPDTRHPRLDNTHQPIIGDRGTEPRTVADDLPARLLQAFKEAARAAAQDFVETAALTVVRTGLNHLIPGSGEIVQHGYTAVKLISSALGVKDGDGCEYQIGLADMQGTFSCLVLRFREGGNDPGQWPQVSLGIDVNLLSPLQPGQAEFNGRAKLPPQQQLEDEPPWGGEWTMEYGMEGIRNPAAVLGRYRWMSVTP